MQVYKSRSGQHCNQLVAGSCTSSEFYTPHILVMRRAPVFMALVAALSVGMAKQDRHVARQRIDEYSTLSSDSQNHGPSKKIRRCYQCAWSPPKLWYAELKPIDDGHQGNGQNQAQVVKLKGGWGKCPRTLNKDEAERYGISTSECDSNCYSRTDKNGNFYRGCYKGEFNVDQNILGCHLQAGSRYCFCDGELCNNQKAPVSLAGLKATPRNYGAFTNPLYIEDRLPKGQHSFNEFSLAESLDPETATSAKRQQKYRDSKEDIGLESGQDYGVNGRSSRTANNRLVGLLAPDVENSDRDTSRNWYYSQPMSPDINDQKYNDLRRPTGRDGHDKITERAIDLPAIQKVIYEKLYKLQHINQFRPTPQSRVTPNQHLHRDGRHGASASDSRFSRPHTPQYGGKTSSLTHFRRTQYEDDSVGERGSKEYYNRLPFGKSYHRHGPRVGESRPRSRTDVSGEKSDLRRRKVKDTVGDPSSDLVPYKPVKDSDYKYLIIPLAADLRVRDKSVYGRSGQYGRPRSIAGFSDFKKMEK